MRRILDREDASSSVPQNSRSKREAEGFRGQNSKLKKGKKREKDVIYGLPGGKSEPGRAKSAQLGN
jgi:hypothetical protein